jgi:hypothetical protein
MELDALPTYQTIIDSLKRKKRTVHLLIGNGFSMAYDYSIFSYNALSAFIEHTENEMLKRLFNTINTKNFEEIMQQLDIFAKLVEVFGIDGSFRDKINDISGDLKNSLIVAVKSLHPEHVFTIPEENSIVCYKFLEQYLSNSGFVFSSNYDLLLYWVLMRNKSQNAIDGFGREVENETGDFIPEDELEYSELRWGKYKSDQNIFYLHGALPLFDTGIEIIKEEYNGDFLLEQIEKRIHNGEYPVFVTAGNAQEKLKHIAHNKYLTFCYDRLCSITGSLVTIGFSLGDNDTHIIDAVNKAAKLRNGDMLLSVYIGVFSDSDLQHMQKIEDKFKCKKVHYFNAKTANIWGNNAK